MSKPCHLLHDDSPTCPICKMFRTSEPHRRLWSGESQQRPPVLLDPPIDCPHRSSEPTGYCGTCAGSGHKYDCEHFDETVVLYPRKGMRDCRGCEANPNRISLPLVTA